MYFVPRGTEILEGLALSKNLEKIASEASSTEEMQEFLLEKASIDNALFDIVLDAASGLIDSTKTAELLTIIGVKLASKMPLNKVASVKELPLALATIGYLDSALSSMLKAASASNRETVAELYLLNREHGISLLRDCVGF